jgi:hypothetical protein
MQKPTADNAIKTKAKLKGMEGLNFRHSSRPYAQGPGTRYYSF